MENAACQAALHTASQPLLMIILKFPTVWTPLLGLMGWDACSERAEGAAELGALGAPPSAGQARC